MENKKLDNYSFTEKIDILAEESLIALDDIEEVCKAQVKKDMLKDRKNQKKSKLEVKEERNGVTASTKQTRNVYASDEWDIYLNELEEKMLDNEINIKKRENAKIHISMWQTSKKEKDIKV
jgi:hypothetical protein